MDAIFTFHSLDTSGSVLSYPPDDLRRFAEGLLAEGASLVTLDEILQPAPDERPRAALTFDDGFCSVHREALPILGGLGVPATLYAVSAWVGKNNRWPGQDPRVPTLDLMSWDELRELSAAGFEIGCHTANHVRLNALASDDWQREVEDSRARLAHELGADVRHFAYPYGVHDATVVGRVAQHYDTAVTADMGFLGTGRPAHRLPRIDAYYLRNPRRHLPIFGTRTRSYLAVRTLLRNVKALFTRP